MRRLFGSRGRMRQGACALLLLMALVFQQPPDMDFSGSSLFRGIEGKGDERIDNHTKKILFYNTFWQQPDFQFGTGREPFLDYQCPVSNCWIQTMKDINESNSSPSYLSQFDAVLFSVQPEDHFNITEERDNIQKWRQPNQRFVFFMMESQ
eukprot:CAMPEP_0176166912 /NCGR_PEP_ID=MMETSP0120_2-20121206/85375_1 /TAXON_ID=160619 /ORGANISM="Kryptoperidinium foliaceum, Strain CCMP 1326" /LENGTH=150 /DNA_ID=CAMNT_0017504483 /DNA_START=96 /DNA_END=545 /DNA_ORIENTATION=-